MGLAPLPNTLHVVGTSEVVAVGRLAKPAPLAGQLAGVAAGRFAAVMLAVVVAVIGEEKLVAATALASPQSGTHRVPKPTRSRRELKQNQQGEEEPKTKKEETSWREPAEEKTAEENTISNRRF
jgi:hypothetical protein